MIQGLNMAIIKAWKLDLISLHLNLNILWIKFIILPNKIERIIVM